MLNKAALLAAAPFGLALLAGAALPFQASSNASLGRTLGHPLWGAMVSLVVSLLVIIPTLWVVNAPAPTLAPALRGPWWLWIGGVVGAVYVCGATVLIPSLGAAGFLVCVVAGQMVTAVLSDHHGWMGLAEKPVTLTRLAGVALILLGVLLVHGLGNRQPPA